MNHFLLLLFFLFNFQALLYSQTDIPVPALAGVDNAITSFMKKWDIPGGSAALVKDGKLIYAKAFGYADLNTPTQPFHLFRIASLTKPLTSIAIMKLIEEGKLHMDDRIFGKTGILNDPIYLNISDERTLGITIKHLLQHSGGWDRETSPYGDPMFDPVGIANAMNLPPPADQITIIRYMLEKKLDFTPGTAYAYSNFGYNILGRVIEKISGDSYDEYIKTSILYPLGIFDMQTGNNYYGEKYKNEVQYYTSTMNIPLMKVPDQQGWQPAACGGFNIKAMDSHGGWIASATSLARLLTAVDGYESKPDILNKDMVSLMVSPSPTNPSYANGWFVNQQGNWWHTGSLPGTSSMMARLNNGISWVILFNKKGDEINYFNELDQLMWSALGTIKTWPDHDLFYSSQSGIGVKPFMDQIHVFPNPASDFVKIILKLNEGVDVNISIIDPRGIQINVIADCRFDKGEHELIWDCNAQVSGMYFCKIQVGEKIDLKKIILP